ncbi:MAG: type II/IV secretion system protein [Planctomycetes bacterium]|nr:type II/IV secretion system protein [Planctomycetota bacterium]
MSDSRMGERAALTSSELRSLPRVGQMLIEDGVISVLQLREALKRQAAGGQRLLLGEVLLQMEVVDRDTLLRAVARSLDIPFLSEPSVEADAAMMRLLPDAMRREHRVVPLRREGDVLVLATADPQNDHVRELAQRETGLRVRFVASPADRLDAMLAEAPATDTVKEKAEEIVAEMGEGEAAFTLQEKQVEEMVGTGQADDMGPVVKLVNFIIGSAVQEGASDIHIEPDEGSMRVRFRIDGVLGHKMSPPWRMSAAIASRIKIMAHMDISERRMPQDGEISVRVNGRPIDLRVSTLPGKFGEKIVMRVVDSSGSRLGLEQLGFRPGMLDRFQQVIDQPYGIVLVTGPTGSGKSTTLYSVLNTFDRTSINVSTVEDPVESNIEGVHQAQINPKAGFTFASALRSLLRQDPDVIMVGEIRDAETAQIAVQAALTGHVVLSTLHTNDAPSAITRLGNLGVENFLIAASLRGVLAQRLVRRVCRQCAAPCELTEPQRLSMGLYGHQPGTPMRGTGCRKCRDTGLSGRVGLYELMVPDERMNDLLCGTCDPAAIRALLREQGFENLWDDGMHKVLAGLTTPEEVHGACRH